MALAINHNLMASNVANSLNNHYSQLATSTERLSTGLRINSAADDAAGLAIRELMRADIAALHQGARNANDAISMIQTADAALGIIDEKLIRMKELAEQAATGTYDSTQRLMISSEFKQMADEIDRIANATDFNGIHLLNGNLQGAHNGQGITPTGAMKIHFGTGNDAAEDYYYVEIPKATINGLFEQEGDSDSITIIETKTVTENLVIPALTTGLQNGTWTQNADDSNKWDFNLVVDNKVAGTGENAWLTGLDRYYLPAGFENLHIDSRNAGMYYHKPHVTLFGKDGTQLTGYALDDPYAATWWNGLTEDDIIKFNQAFYNNASLDASHVINQTGETYTYSGITLTMLSDQSENAGLEQIFIPTKLQDAADEFVFMIGGHANGVCNNYYLHIWAEGIDDSTKTDLQSKISEVISPEETIQGATYTIEIEHYIPVMNLDTQDRAQRMLEKIDNAIVNKDKIRAHLGALQNRLENTITNITTQAENLQASESRISDIDVATEMTNFVRSQILTQSAVAMLSQANSLPQMAMQLIG